MKKIMMITSALLVLVIVSFSQVPRTKNYRAKLTNETSDIALDGSYDMAFTIWDDSTSGTSVWTDTLTGITITNGLVDVRLGYDNGDAESGSLDNPIKHDFSGPRWLEIAINDGGGWETFSPREKLAPVSYAHRAVYADTADTALNAADNQTLSEVLSEGNDAGGSRITNLTTPTSSSDAVTKEYVDASTDATSDRPYCIYVDDNYNCPAGWTEQGSSIGAQFSSGDYTRICCKSTETGSGGYLVLTSSTYQGRYLGGLSGADSECLSQVKNTAWQGKGKTDSLTSNNVKAFLCDADSCHNLKPNSTYSFAKCGETGTGGASFTTDGKGRGPRNSDSWNGGNYFNTSNYAWTHRGISDAYGSTRWATTPASYGDCCNNWTSLSNQPYVGYTSSTSEGRWHYNNYGCSSDYHLICIVNK